MTSCGGSFHDSIQFGSIGGGHAIPAFIEVAHAVHQTVEVASPIQVVESTGQRFGMYSGGMSGIIWKREHVKQILQLAGAVEGVVIAVADQREFVERETQGQEGLSFGEVFAHLSHSTVVLPVTFVFGQG